MMLAKIVAIYAFSVCKIILPESWVVLICWQISSLYDLSLSLQCLGNTTTDCMAFLPKYFFDVRGAPT